MDRWVINPRRKPTIIIILNEYIMSHLVKIYFFIPKDKSMVTIPLSEILFVVDSDKLRYPQLIKVQRIRECRVLSPK